MEKNLVGLVVYAWPYSVSVSQFTWMGTILTQLYGKVQNQPKNEISKIASIFYIKYSVHVDTYVIWTSIFCLYKRQYTPLDFYSRYFMY